MTGLIIAIGVIAYVFLGCWCVLAAEANSALEVFLGVVIGPILLIAGIIWGAFKKLHSVTKGWFR